MKKPHNIYIHVPFCVSKCRYCAFYSHACANPDWDKYTDEILQEITNWAQVLGKIQIPTIFFGGGTPSLMPTKYFEKIINKINYCFDINPDAEITLESNPGTINKNKMYDFKNAGVNRLSIGVQSLDDNKLKFLGRTHNANDAIATIKHAQQINLNVSGDFIYGLPGETTKDITKICHDINEIGLKHCSLYELTIEPETPLAKSNPIMPDNDTMAQMYTAIQDTLALPRYEISNYAAHGHECRHNQNIWDGEPYIGIGRGAAGRIYQNRKWYEQRGNGTLFKEITDKERAVEKIITGMRTVRGVRLTDDVKDAINMNTIDSLSDLVATDGNRMWATDKGMLVLDDTVLKIVR